MPEEVFPEIQRATEALESRIAITEAEVAQMKEAIGAKRLLFRSWRKALATFNPKRAAPKKRALPKQQSARSPAPLAGQLQ
jgi:hypothetical protein